MQRELVLENGHRLTLLQGDITRIAVDAIANAANSGLAGGGGVDGAIHRAGGSAIMAELDRLRPTVGTLRAGQAVATSAGRLPARYVFHASGPIWRGGSAGEPEALASCYRVCLCMAEERELRSINLPSISTGIYGYPLDQAAPIALREIIAFLSEHAHSVESVSMVLLDEQTYLAYDRALSKIAPEVGRFHLDIE